MRRQVGVSRQSHISTALSPTGHRLKYNFEEVGIIDPSIASLLFCTKIVALKVKEITKHHKFLKSNINWRNTIDPDMRFDGHPMDWHFSYFIIWCSVVCCKNAISSGLKLENSLKAISGKPIYRQKQS